MATTPPTPSDDPSAPKPPSVDRRTLQAARRKERKRSKRRWPKRLAITLVVLVVLAGGLVGGAYVYANYRYDQIKKVHIPHLATTSTTTAETNNSTLTLRQSFRLFVNFWRNSIALVYRCPSIRG